MSAPDEPESSKIGDGPDSLNGVPDRGGAHRVADTADTPAWQRGTGRSRKTGQRPTPEGTARQEIRSSGPPDVEARVSRFISGTAAPAAVTAASSAPPADPTQESPPATPRGDGRRTEAYASELPDLSGPLPRTTHRKTAADRAGDETRASAPNRAAAGESRFHVSSRRTSGPVRASMQIRRIDPWSTLKTSLILSVALFFVWMISVAFLYLVLGGMGVWSKLNSNVGDLLTNTGGGSGELVSSGTIFGGAVLIGLVNIVLLTAMATIGAFIYNLTTDLIGGIEVTLADRD